MECFVDTGGVEPICNGHWPVASYEEGLPVESLATSCDTRRRPRGGQKPLRSRQRAIQSLEAELAQKLQAFKEAQDEKARLQQRMKVLEVVLPVREQRMQLLKQRHQTCHASGQARRPATLRIAEAALGSDSSPTDSGVSSSQAEEVACDSSTAAGSGEGHMRATAAEGGPCLLNPACTAVSPCSVKAGPCGTPAHVIRQFMAVWNQWVREAGLVLHSHDARPHDPGPQLKLAALREALLRTWRALQLEHPQLAMDLIGLNMETGEREEAPAESLWASIVQALRFSPGQVADCRAALELYRERREALLTERRGLVVHMTSCLATHRCHRRADVANTCGEALVRMTDLSARLQRNVLAERQAVEMVKDFLGSCLLSLVQMVRASVLCYPFFPDAIALITTIVEVAAAVEANSATPLSVVALTN